MSDLDELLNEYELIDDLSDDIVIENINTPYVHKYFPPIFKEYRNLLSYDHIGLYSITPPKSAYIITSYVLKYYRDTNIVVTDAMAGLGGNTLSFSENLYYVNSIEYDLPRFYSLVSNVSLYKRKNVLCIHANYLKIMTLLKQDIIFMDPPWGGKNYKENDKMTINIDGRDLSNICNEIFDKRLCSMLLLKLPLNYDVATFSDKLKSNMKLQRLPKILIVSILC